MANKKINELDSRASLSLSDLMAVGDPSTGYLYKTTISDLKTLTGAGVISFNGRFGAVVPVEGDYALTQLSDVIITSASNGQVLKFNGSNWVNATEAGETDTLGSVTTRGNTTSNGIVVGSVTAAGLSNQLGHIKTFATTGNAYIGDSPTTATDNGAKLQIAGSISGTGDIVFGTAATGYFGFYSAGAGYYEIASSTSSSYSPSFVMTTGITGTSWGLYGGDGTYTGMLLYRQVPGNVEAIYWDVDRQVMPTASKIVWAASTLSGTNLAQVSTDIGIARDAVNVLQINNGTIGSYASLKALGATFTGLAGTGSRVVSADANGVLSASNILSGYLPLTGGTLTGELIVSPAATTAKITLNAPTGQLNTLMFKVNNVQAGWMYVNEAYYQFNSATTNGYLFKNSAGSNIFAMTDAGQADFIAKLTVNTGGTDNQFALVGAAPSVRLSNATSGATINGFIAMSGATNNYITGSAAGDMCIGNQNGGKIIYGFGSGTATPFMTITSTGVGIGTSSPSSILVVRSGSTNDSLSAESQVTITNTTSGNYATLGFRSVDSDGDHGRAGITVSKDSGSISGAMNFIVRKDAGSFINAIRITSTGNVGIGTSSPVEKLDVTKNGNQADVNWGAIMVRNTANYAVGNDASIGFALNNSSNSNCDPRASIGCKTESDLGGALVFNTRLNGGTYSEKMRITGDGKFYFNAGSNTGYRVIVGSTNGTRSVIITDPDAEGYAGGTTAMYVAKQSSTNRSINAAGTINASGADYAEYMTKSDIEVEFAKGDIIGINADGKLTDSFINSISFVIKSTDPSYVGGDTWFTEVKPGKTNEQTDKEYAIIEAEWDARYQQARKSIDRIAFSGQVPCNVTDANVGDYIIPVNDNGKIKGIAVKNPTLDQYQIAVGKVWKIMDDGRAWVAVKIG